MVFKLAKDSARFGPPLWFEQSTQEALARYDNLASQPSSHDPMLQEWNDEFHLSESDLPYPIFTHPSSQVLPDFTQGCLAQGSQYL